MYFIKSLSNPSHSRLLKASWNYLHVLHHNLTLCFLQQSLFISAKQHFYPTSALLHQAQQVAVKSFAALKPVCPFVWRAEVVGLNMAAVVLILQVLQDGEDDFSLLRSSGPEGEHAHAKRKLIGHTYLVCLCQLDCFSFLHPPPLSAEGRDFPLSLIFTLEQHGWKTGLDLL